VGDFVSNDLAEFRVAGFLGLGMTDTPYIEIRTVADIS
jgi:hypothetical protein